MLYKLIYPTDKLKEVNVGIFSDGVHKIASNVKLLSSGKAYYHLVADVCVDVKPDDFVGISQLDYSQILGLAWKQSYNRDVKVLSETCSCGNIIHFQHPVFFSEVVPHEAFTKPNTFRCVDFDGEEKDFVVKMRSPTMEQLVNIMLLSEDDQHKIIEIPKKDCIVSINDAPYTGQKMPLALNEQVIETINKENDDLEELRTKKVKCVGCNNELESVLNVLDASFLS